MALGASRKRAAFEENSGSSAACNDGRISQAPRDHGASLQHPRYPRRPSPPFGSLARLLRRWPPRALLGARRPATAADGFTRRGWRGITRAAAARLARREGTTLHRRRVRQLGGPWRWGAPRKRRSSDTPSPTLLRTFESRAIKRHLSSELYDLPLALLTCSTDAAAGVQKIICIHSPSKKSLWAMRLSSA